MNKLDDGNGKNEVSSVIHRRRKSKDEGISPNPTSPLQNNNNRISSGFSFLNPRHASLKQQNEMNQKSLQNSSSILIEENLNQTNVGRLLDFGNEDLNQDLGFERSFSSDGQRDFNSSLESQTNLLDDVFSISQKNSTPIILPSPIVATTIPKAASERLFPDRCQSFLMQEDVVSYSFTVFFLFLLIQYIRRGERVLVVPLRWDI